MNMIFIHISTALKQLIKNKARTALTMLGIIIGIGSVIFIMTLGEVAKNFLLGQITQFGTNVIEIAPPGAFGPFGASDQAKLTLEDIDMLQDSPLLPEITSVAGGISVIKSFEYNGFEQSVSVYGDGPAFFEVNNIKPVKGRLLNTSDVSNASRSMVVTDRLAQDLFHSEDIIGKRVKIGGTFFTIIGIVEELAFGGGFGPDMVYIPVSTVQQVFGSSLPDIHEINFLLVQFESGANVDSLKNRIDYELRRKKNLLDSEEEVFTIMSREQALDIFDSVLLGIQAFVSAVAAISLLVGGIGIMNIMLVTVKERTKEIGLRKSIGAKNSSIRYQFLIESIVLTTVGGIIGIIVGLGLSLGAVLAVSALKPEWNVSFVFVPQAVFLASTVAAVVGLVFGMYPAWKASRLHPIEALRYE